MKTGLPSALLLAVALAMPSASAQILPGKSGAATSLALKRVAERYALTQARITTLLGPRRNPAPLPTDLPNPFYVPSDLPPVAQPPGDPGESTVVPAMADESDADTLAKFAATLRIGGVTVRNGVPHLTLNTALCKAGDTIPYESRGRTVYIQVVGITANELTLGLNTERQTVRIKR